MAKSQKSYEEFYFKPTKSILPLHVIENYAKSHSGDYGYYEQKIFCPECNIPQLTLVQNDEGHSYHLRKYPKQPHDKDCSYNHEYASKKATIDYYKSLNDLQIKNKLYGAMLWLKKQSKIKNVQVESTVDKTKTRDSNPFLFASSVKGSSSKTYKALRRKNLNNGLSDVIFGELYIFYGKVKLETVARKVSNGRTYNFLVIKSKDSNDDWIRLVEIMRWYTKDNVDSTKEYDLVLIGILGPTFKDINGIKRRNKKQIDLISPSALDFRLMN